MAAAKGIWRCPLTNRSRSDPLAGAQVFLSRGFAAKLFVSGIPFSSKEKTLIDAFSKYGEVLEAKIIMNKATNRSKGYGFVTFASKVDAQKALESMNGKLLGGRLIYVSY